MSDELFEMLANAKTKGGTDGDWILPTQRGVIIVRRFFEVKSGLKKTVFFAGEILESNAKEAGAATQPPGTKVKVCYSLTKQDWAIDNLKTDIVNMSGIDEKGLDPADVAEIFRGVFVDNVMCGYAVEFNSFLDDTIKKKGDPRQGQKRDRPFTKIHFHEAKGAINEESAVKARAEKIKAELKAA